MERELVWKPSDGGIVVQSENQFRAIEKPLRAQWSRPTTANWNQICPVCAGHSPFAIRWFAPAHSIHISNVSEETVEAVEAPKTH